MVEPQLAENVRSDSLAKLPSLLADVCQFAREIDDLALRPELHQVDHVALDLGVDVPQEGRAFITPRS